MMRVEASPIPHLIAVVVCFVAIPALGAWPTLQTVANTLLVVGLAPLFKSPLLGGLLASLAGWLVELTLRNFPMLGGVPLANLTTMLIAYWSLIQWPPNQESTFRGRLALLVIVHALLTTGGILLAAGPHMWNLWGWGLTLATSPLWSIVVAWFYAPPQRR